MTLIKYSPNTFRPTTFSGLLDTFFDDSFQGGSQMDFTPSVDIAETKDTFEIQMQVPGVKKEDITISLENDLITISGERRYDNQTNDKNFHSRESFYGKFNRSFRLPDAVNGDKIQAKQEDGILIVSLPKDEKKASKKLIKIG
jgi:HSP20 family protein